MKDQRFSAVFMLPAGNGQLQMLNLIGRLFQVWSVHVELKQVEVVEEPVERKLEHVAIRITEVTDRFTFFAQNVNDGKSHWLVELWDAISVESRVAC